MCIGCEPLWRSSHDLHRRPCSHLPLLVAGHKPGATSSLADSAATLQSLAGVVQQAGVLGGASFAPKLASKLELTHNWFNTAKEGAELMYL